MKNNLWKQKYKPHFGVRLAKTEHDPLLCGYCSKIATCSPGPCFFLSRVNENKERKEALISDVCKEETELRDYKQDLAELIEDRRQRLINTVHIAGIKQRSIAILQLAGISQSDIAALFSMSYRQINRIANKKAPL